MSNVATWLANATVDALGTQVFGALLGETDIRYSFVHVTQEVYAHHQHATKDKLVGKLSWPFLLTLPQTVELEEDGVKKQFRLPENLYIRYGRSDIMYRISVKVTHGSFLHPHQE